jgi:hypothetical protein
LAATIGRERAVAWLAEINAQRQAAHRLLMAGLFLHIDAELTHPYDVPDPAADVTVSDAG